MTSEACREGFARLPAGFASRCSATHCHRAAGPDVRLGRFGRRPTQPARRSERRTRKGAAMELHSFEEPLGNRKAAANAKRFGGYFQTRRGLLPLVFIA